MVYKCLHREDISESRSGRARQNESQWLESEARRMQAGKKAQICTSDSNAPLEQRVMKWEFSVMVS